MNMIIDTLETKKKEMKKLQTREAFKKNKSQQEKTDGRYRILLTQAHRTVDIIQYLNSSAHFTPSDTIKTDLLTLFSLLQAAVDSGLADASKVEKGEQDLKKILAAAKKEWAAYYSEYTGGTVSTLKVISGIDKTKTSECLSNIQGAAGWETERKVYEKLVASMAEADTLISSLDMDQNVISFLQKMNMGQATLADLNPKVNEWIKKESIEKKIRLSFMLK